MMENLVKLIYIVLQAALLLFLAPLASGIIKKCRAFLQNRSGAPLLQDYYDLYKWWRRPIVLLPQASFFHTLAPCAYFVALTVAASMLPLFAESGDALGDMFVCLALAVLGRFCLLLAAYDAEQPVAVLGAAREMYLAVFAEPLLLVAVLANTLHSGSTAMSAMLPGTEGEVTVAGVLMGVAFFIILLAENNRLPLDDPEGSLPTALGHEALLQCYSGRLLALIRWADQLKLLLFLLLFTLFYLPLNLPLLLKLLLAAVALALVETLHGRMPLFQKQLYLAAGIMLLLALIAQ